MAKRLLTENFSRDWKENLNIKKLPLQESAKLVEAEGKQYTVLEKWEVPVWRLDKKNLNDRTYSTKLGQKVVKENKDLVTANLADHPEEDGSVKDILAVSKNPHIRDGILYVDSYVVDEVFEKKLNKMIEAGFGMGVSSSVYGDTDDDGNVLEEGLEVDRFFDYVLSPSYSVYVTEESKVQESIVKENLTINKEPIKESHNMADDKLQRLNEKTMRLNLEKIIEDADKKETISERLEALTEASSYVSSEFLPDMNTKILEKLESLKKESLELAEKGKTVDKLTEDIQLKETEKLTLQEKHSLLESEKKALEEKYEIATKLLDETKEYANKAVDLLESANADVGSKFSAGEYVKVLESLEEAVSDSDFLLEKMDELEKELDDAKAEAKACKEKLAKQEKILNSKIKVLESEVNDYKKEIEDGLMNEKELEEDFMGDENEYNTNEFNYGEYGAPIVHDDLELDVGNEGEVEGYYDDLVSEDPRYESIKSEILRCKTLIEAQRTALRLKSLVEKQDTIRRPDVAKDSRAQIKYTEADVSKLKRKGWK